MINTYKVTVTFDNKENGSTTYTCNTERAIELVADFLRRYDDILAITVTHEEITY